MKGTCHTNDIVGARKGLPSVARSWAVFWRGSGGSGVEDRAGRLRTGFRIAAGGLAGRITRGDDHHRRPDDSPEQVIAGLQHLDDTARRDLRGGLFHDRLMLVWVEPLTG